MKSSSSFHLAYIIGSFAAAFIALVGLLSESPVLYGIIPGIIGGLSAVVATVRFIKDKTDLAGFIATICGFVFYQEFQANPVTRPEFLSSMQSIPIEDQAIGLFLSNLTTAMLLIACHILANSLHGLIRRWVPDPARVPRKKIDRTIMTGFWVVLTIVAVPNVLFGKVVIGALDNIVNQRMDRTGSEILGGFSVWGGAVGASVVNMALWATSLFLLWLYLLRSRYRWRMLMLAPLVLIWTAGVGLQGSRTYLVTMGIAAMVYLLGSPRFGRKAFGLAVLLMPSLFLLVQISTYFRTSGLKSVNLTELSEHMFEIRGNEGASAQIDGIQCFRTELLEKGQAPNPVIGAFRGLVERPIEGLLIPVPRTLFPWKPVDTSSKDFNLWFQNVRLGAPSSEEFLGASPGLMGRELIKYGIVGPLTLLFWLGFVLALADRLFATGAASDFHRIFAALLVAFFVAQVRDFVPLWFLPFLPAGVVFVFVVRQTRRKHPARLEAAHNPGLNPINGAQESHGSRVLK